MPRGVSYMTTHVRPPLACIHLACLPSLHCTYLKSWREAGSVAVEKAPPVVSGTVGGHVGGAAAYASGGGMPGGLGGGAPAA